MSNYPSGCCRSCWRADDTQQVRRCTREANHEGDHTKGTINWDEKGYCAWADGTLATFEEWEAQAGAKPAGE